MAGAQISEVDAKSAPFSQGISRVAFGNHREQVIFVTLESIPT
jgi:hypothetical protein